VSFVAASWAAAEVKAGITNAAARTMAAKSGRHLE
jgi:hypothetical protein